MKEKTVRLTLRLPSSLHKRIQAEAMRERRTLNAEIVYLLERALEQLEKKEADEG